MEYTEYIKVNLPKNENDYISGTGEGVFVKVKEYVKKAYDDDEIGIYYSGILDNDSVYYPELKRGTLIPIEMRGKNRPVCYYYFLTGQEYI